MNRDSRELSAAVALADRVSELLGGSHAFQNLDPATRNALRQDLDRIRQALASNPDALASEGRDPYALALETPAEVLRRRRQAAAMPQNDQPATQAQQPAPRAAATETLASRTGALSDEIDFPGFVASLIHGTFDAIVDSSIRQMEAFASLVSAVAKDVDRFTTENVTTNQVRDYLVEQHPADLMRVSVDGEPRLAVRQRDTAESAAATDDSASDGSEAVSPSWLADYGLEGEELTGELVETQIIPAARRQVGEQRLKLLATMVLLGMNRIVVRDGSISAKVRFRAAARDRSQVDFAQASDPGPTWGNRGGAFSQSGMMVSTVGANVQSDTELRAELFGEVKINFASETLPLERFADAAQMLLLQRNARPVVEAATRAPAAPESPASAPPPLPAPPPQG
jgi:hypothetical protein